MHQRLRMGLRFSMTFFIMALITSGIRDSTSVYAASSYTVTLYPAYQDQAIEGWGTSLAWWANRAGGWDDATRNAIADALYDPGKGIGLNIARYNFGADTPTNSCHNQMPAGRNVPSYEPSPGNFDWSQDANQRWMIQAAQARGANLFEGFVNAPPAWMLNNHCTAGSTLPGQDNISSSQYDHFTSYLTTIARHFHDVWGIPLRTLDPFNEPSSWWWLSNGNQEAMYVSQATQNALINQLGAALANQHMSTYSNVSAPDDNSIDNGLREYTSYDSSAQGYLTQWNTHGYNGSNRSGSYSAIGQRGNKRIWMSEWGENAQASPMAAALDLSKRILLDEQQLHPSAWVLWQALDEPGASNANDLWGLIAGDNTTGLSYPSRYWAFGNYSKFVRPGYKMIENSDSNSFTAYDAGTHTLAIVTTNSSSSDETVTYNLSSFNNVSSSATPYQTSATENLQQLGSIAIDNKQFTSVLPASSITTFVLPNITYAGPGAPTEVDDGVQGSGIDQFNYAGNGWSHCTGCLNDPSGLYNGSKSWDSTAGDAATMTFQGSRIRLFGVKAPDSGIGQVSVDHGPASEVDFY
ncbi:MAG: hypothetical protein JO031_03625, partial [Ktedonobacteraceae bacterium]|nr:hypothetical protein [Ktedonobacteraceae bacterium]